jgi:hypothetical protein
MKKPKIINGEPMIEHECSDCKSQHTPTPFDDIHGPKGGYLRDLYKNLMTLGYFESRAIDIVRAVNSHEDLVHTLANALHELRSVNANQFVIQQCEQAIAKAEGK